MNRLKSPQIYAVLLTWNDEMAALQCLRTLRTTDYPNLTTIVVDNASEDNTVSAIRRAYPECRLIVNPSNLGFAAGCNVGIQSALAEGADFVILINQDSIVDPQIFTCLTEAAIKYPQAGILAPKTYFMTKMQTGQERLLYAGSWRGRLPLQQKLPGIEEADTGEYDTPAKVDYAWGHGMFLRSDMLKEVGLLDEVFFMYYEDLDLCRRAVKAGYEIWYIPKAVMWHDLPDGARTTKPERWRLQYRLRSLFLFYKKHYGRWLGNFLAACNIIDDTRQMWQRGHRTAAKLLVAIWLRLLLLLN